MPDIPDFETFCADPQLIGEPITPAWVTFYKSVEGLPLTTEQEELFRAATGRDRYVPRTYTDCSCICGRRSEKTQTALKFLIFKALFGGYERHGSWLRRATRITRRLRIPLIAQDLRVAQDLKRTAESLCIASPVVREELADVRVNEIVFRNGVSLICLPASRASVRGFTCPGCLLDELAWVVIEGASDRELVRQVRPSMIQFGDTRRLIKLSTPWQSSGVLYEEYSARAERTDILVWQASTAVMTPRIPADELAREREADPAYYEREYEARFTADLEAFLPAVDIHAAVRADRPMELAPQPTAYYVAALDASGLSGGDTFTFGIGHSGEGGFIVDLLRGWRRAAVPSVCDEIANLCRAYRVRNIIADQYSFTFLAELMRQRDIGLEQLAFSARSKPELFFDLKNALSQGAFALPPHTEAVRELRSLESVRTSGGNYRISAPRGQHDDYPTVLALLANKVKRSRAKFFMPQVLDIQLGAPAPPPPPGTWRDPRAGVDVYDPRVDLPGEKWHKL